jgi:hypothetical protein
MAHLKIKGSRLRLNLSRFEVMGALHSSPEVEISTVESVEIVDNPWSARYLKGIRAPGTAIPFRILLGTMRYRGGKDFCAIYRRRPSAIITFKRGEFKRWIFEIKDVSEVESLKALM